MGVDVGSAVGYLDLDISGFLSGLKSAQSEADRTTKNIATKIGNNLNNAGKHLTSAGSALTKSVTVPVVGAGAAIVKMSSDFESAMSKVQAISGSTGKDMVRLTEKAKEMGAKTKFSATESAEAFTYMAMAGWKTEDMLNGIDGIMSLAAADGLDLATTSDIVTDAITAFGLTAEDSAHFADVLAAASSNANTNVSMLGESFKYAAPVAGALGYSAEDTAIALGLMANAGIKGSQGGTALRGSLSRLIKPSDDAATMMEKYGISLTNADGSMKSLGGVMEMLRENLGGLSEAEQAQAAATIFGQEAMSGMLAIINASEGDFDKLTDAIYGSEGAAKTMSDTMLNNLKGQVVLLKSALEGLAIEFGEIILPYLKKFVGWVQQLVAKFQALTPEQKEQVVKWAAIAAAIGPVLLIFGKLISSVGSIITVFGKIPGAFKVVTGGATKMVTSFKNIGEAITLTKAGFPAMAGQASKLGAAIGGITAPVAAVIAIIGVLIAAFVTLWKTNDKFRKNLEKTWKKIQSTFKKFADGLVSRLNELGFNFKDITDVLSTVWKNFCELLAPLFEGVFENIAIIFETVLNVITGILDVFIGLFTGDWEQCWNGVKEIFFGIWNGIKDWFTNILNTLRGAADVFLGWFGTSWDECWNSIKSFFVNTWNSIYEFFAGILSSITEFFTTTWNNIVMFFTTTLNNIKMFFMNIWNSISTFLSDTWETIKNVVHVGIMFIVELFQTAFELITLPFRFIWENCKETIISVWEAIKTAVSNALTFIQTLITNVWNSVSTFFTTIWTAISSFFSSIWSGLKNIVSSGLSYISSFITTVWTNVSTFFTTIWNGIKSFFSGVWEGLKSIVTNAVNAIRNTITSIFNAISSFVSSIWYSIKNTTTSVWNSIKSAITGPINSAKSTVSGAIDSIKSYFYNGFTSAKNTVSSIFGSISSKISSIMSTVKNTVYNAIQRLKSYFNFSWSLPRIKLPHFSISGRFSLNPPQIPHFSVSWYKKAMGRGMILNSPTIFGYDGKSGKFLGGGEAGSETVVGTHNLMSMIKAAVNGTNRIVLEKLDVGFASLYAKLAEINDKLFVVLHDLIVSANRYATSVDGLGYVVYNGFTKKAAAAEKQIGDKQNDSKGDTFNFYSPKPIDEIEAAERMKRAKRDLAEGF